MHASVQPRYKCVTPSDFMEMRRHNPRTVDHNLNGGGLFETERCPSPSSIESINQTANTAPTNSKRPGTRSGHRLPREIVLNECWQRRRQRSAISKCN